MPKWSRRVIIPSDDYQFIARVYDLSIVGMHFGPYEEASCHPDAKYVLDVNDRASLLTERVESLNSLGGALWPGRGFSLKQLPISAFDYCNTIHDAFLMRIVSVFDCCCLLTAEVLELDLHPRQARLSAIRKASSGHVVCTQLEALRDFQTNLRNERNMRFHRAEESALTDDDTTFKVAALWTHWGSGITGTDRYGREINVRRSFYEALRKLRVKFNANLNGLRRLLNMYYDCLELEFEDRFHKKFHGENSYGKKTLE